MPPLTNLPTWIGISCKWDTLLFKLAGDGECRQALFYAIRNFLVNGIYHFSRLSHQTGCIFTLAPLSIESAPYSAPSVCSVLQKKFEAKFLEFEAHFPQNLVSIGCNIFPLVLVICLCWYLHLQLSHEFLTLVSFNIWRQKFTSGAIYLKLWKANGI